VSSPLTLLFDLDGGDYYGVMNDLVIALQAEGASVRIKGGGLLEVEGARRRIQMSPYDPTRGRRLESSAVGRDVATTRVRFQEMLATAHKLYVSPDFTPEILLWNRPECISISDVDDRIAQEVTEIARRSGMLMASLRWREDDAVAGEHLWRWLVLTRIVTGGLILTDFEEFPLDEIFDDVLLRWRRSRDPWPPADGFFFSYDSIVYPEEDYEHLEIPPDLVLSEATAPLRTPVERVLDRAGHSEVLRISQRDDPGAPATYAAPYPHLQFPDVSLIERKVREYCLNPAHPERKCEGFAAHGWDLRHPAHSTQLASLLASALLLQFTPHDVRATADGSIQFGVHVALPSFRQGYAAVQTAWVASAGSPIRLASAFVASPLRDGNLDPTFAFEPSSERSWRDIVEEATRFGAQAADDGVTAQARLYISRRGLGNALTRQLVRDGESEGEYRRAAIGGRSILVPVGTRCGWVQAGRTASHAQISLGLTGVLSMPGTWVD
jgi:hypothetical protein